MRMLFPLVQAMSFFLLIAYVFSKSPAFKPLKTETLLLQHKIGLYFFFSAISMIGTYLGLPIQGGAIANTRAIGPVLAGIIGGPFLGTSVGLTGGLHRFYIGRVDQIGETTSLACAIGTTVAGLIGGLVHRYLVKKDYHEQIFNPKIAGLVTAVAEAMEMVAILLVARPYEQALALVKVLAGPMILVNAAGAALFASIIRDKKNMYDKVGAISTARALRIAERTLDLLGKGFNREIAPELAKIIHQETGVGAVAITDSEKVLAFVGHGSDHHLPGSPISSAWTKKAISEKEVVFVDGTHQPYHCDISPDCPLRSVLVVPLHIDDDVIGAIKLYEPANRPFLSLNKTLGEGLTALFSNQLLRSRYQEQKNLLVMAELKLAHAQIDPHFLFNSLNTIVAIMRHDNDRARELISHLSNFFRKNLKRGTELSTLSEELEHVGAYLEIEKARFEDRLSVTMEVDPALLGVKMPTFTLQPLIENAVKHGISNMLTPGIARIRAYRKDSVAYIDIEDNAGTFEENRRDTDGLGLKIVDKRIKGLMGHSYGVSVSCQPNRLTQVSVRLPIIEEAKQCSRP